MTTTIYDKLSKQVASDTRWSVRLTLSDSYSYLVYVDDCSFEKIADRNKTVLVLAGNGPLIAKWKAWWYQSLDTDNLPPTNINGKNEVNLMIIDKSNNQILFDAGQKKSLCCPATNTVLSIFAGSGNIHAASCWLINRNIQKAIVSAAQLDYFTSDIVKFVDFTTGKSNIGEPDYNYDNIVNAILDRGLIMNMQQSTTPNDTGKALTQQQKAELAHLLATGQAVASAPVPGINEFQWTDEQKQKLTKAIDKVKALENI